MDSIRLQFMPIGLHYIQQLENSTEDNLTSCSLSLGPYLIHLRVKLKTAAKKLVEECRPNLSVR